MEEELAITLSNSLKSEAADTVSNLAEAGVDSIMEGALLIEVPFVSNQINA